jgi:thiamine-phosphate pyrophosphorylase
VIDFPRLYAILDLDVSAAHGLSPRDLADIWLDAGIRLIQLRAKQLSAGPLLDLADWCARRAAGSDATFIVNDRVDIAKLAGAAGVHVGQQDLSPADARAILGPGAIVGISTHDDAQIEAGVAAPVDYVAIGPAFATATKVNPDPIVGLAGVRRAAAAARPSGLPVVAIGGITIDTAPALIEAGASAVAVIGDLVAGDPAARAREYLRALR